MTTPLNKSRLQIGPIIIGCWQAGKAMWTNVQESEILAAMHKAFDLNIRSFDTAPSYGSGLSEKILGKAFLHHRHQVVIATKVSSHCLNYNKLISSCERSLGNLKTDYIDLLQIHWPAGSFKSKSVPIAESMRALNKLKSDGKIKAIGVSNFSLQQLQEALAYAEIDCVQTAYSLLWRQAEAALLPFCQQQAIRFLAYSPLAQGLLTGKFSADQTFSATDIRSYNKLFQGEAWHKSLAAVSTLQLIAERQQTSLTSLALAWLLMHPQVCPIVGVRMPQHLTAIGKALRLKLSKKDLLAIDKAVTDLAKQVSDEQVLWDLTNAIKNLLPKK